MDANNDIEKQMLCFEVWRNDEKLTTSGVHETGVLTVILSWVGKEPNASTIAASSAEAIPGIHCYVGGIEGVTHIQWCNTEQWKVGDELRVRIISTDKFDPPIPSGTAPRGNPNWIKKYRTE